MALVASEWHPLSPEKGIFFRKFEVDCMQWDGQLNLEDYKLYAAPFGGPVALIRDSRRIVRVSSIGASAKPFIFLFTPSGREIGVIKWNSGPILELGWSDTEDLIVVQEDGQVLLYDYLGNYRRTFAMGQVSFLARSRNL
ncbi:unnamed protein product [Notodromas monacha]|uniref:Vps16 N-terminal domain-containing protein n=1 Tax=Notodromas monacha TaxID=399045 RepID=A0A7R9BDR0_9CRUS|nr:unnamed protein product [Notodromas monacha]CAG0912361.1 unnamed protein product [Notodromas monacha]